MIICFNLIYNFNSSRLKPSLSRSKKLLHVFWNTLYYLCLYTEFYTLSFLVGCWSSVFIRKIIYKFLDMYPFDYTAFSDSWKAGIPWTGLTTPVVLQ